MKTKSLALALGGLYALNALLKKANPAPAPVQGLGYAPVRLPILPVAADWKKKAGSQAQAVGLVNSIYARFEDEINETADVLDLDPVLIACFAFVESTGDANANANSKAPYKGLMQTSIDTATTILYEFHKAKLFDRLPRLKPLLVRLVGAEPVRVTSLMVNQNFSYVDTSGGKRVTKPITARQKVSNAQLLNPRTNLLLGSMAVKLYCLQHTEGGLVRLDKVIARYNAGHNRKPVGNPWEVYKLARKWGGAETAEYIARLVGTNGVYTSMSLNA